MLWYNTYSCTAPPLTGRSEGGQLVAVLSSHFAARLRVSIVGHKTQNDQNGSGHSFSVRCETRRLRYMANNENAWKAFDTSSEAGRLLRQIYGSKGPPVNIPLPRKSKTSKVPTDGWRPVSNKPTAVDPRTATRSFAKERQVDVPQPVRPRGKKYSAIDFVERKRTNTVIGHEINDMKMRQEAYRPAHVRPQGEAEKVRLGEINAFRGGKGLPEEMTAVKMEVLPSEQIARAKEADRLDRVRRRRAGLPEYGSDAPSKPGSRAGSGMGALAGQLVEEIEERRAHLAEMEELGMISGNERTIAGEIKQRLTELKRIDPKAAETYAGDAGEGEEPSFAVIRVSAPFHRD